MGACSPPIYFAPRPASDPHIPPLGQCTTSPIPSIAQADRAHFVAQLSILKVLRTRPAAQEASPAPSGSSRAATTLGAPRSRSIGRTSREVRRCVLMFLLTLLLVTDIRRRLDVTHAAVRARRSSSRTLKSAQADDDDGMDHPSPSPWLSCDPTMPFLSFLAAVSDPAAVGVGRDGLDNVTPSSSAVAAPSDYCRVTLRRSDWSRARVFDCILISSWSMFPSAVQAPYGVHLRLNSLTRLGP
ncbi:hypothetical protein C8Q74DRAFT_404104 [Fomes fomentarius]|nr:hypothetical protein C8Q74DRAFT_404104 [Fomes fomentarius]